MVVDKPAGWTSHQVVARVRRLLGTRKVGHAGTLDPMATGVLLVGVNAATRLLGHLMLTEKTYTGTVRLGVGTVTDDAEGAVTATPGIGAVAADVLEAALVPLRGDIWQVPTAVSAIKVDGVRSYAKVRAGQEVALAARPVRVLRLEVLDRRPADAAGVPCLDLDVLVECSSGTYVRALARDLGLALGSAGHLTALRRTRVGAYGLDEAQPLAQARSAGRDSAGEGEQAGEGDQPADMPPPALRLLGLAEVARRSFTTCTVTAEQAADVGFGRRLPALPLSTDPTALLSPDGDFLALYRPDGAGARPVAVFVGGG